MGISGGLDSSYLAYLGSAKWGLKILAVHVQDGYDTEISLSNIKRLCDKAHIHLITVKPDPEQYNGLIMAYMKSGVPNLCAPQDNICIANLYDQARINRIKYFLLGANFALESILQRGNTWTPYDLTNIKGIHRRFNDKPIDKLAFISLYKRRLYDHLYGLKTVYPLNYLDYNRDRAFKELKDFCGFQYYGRKHLENYLTAFAQLCWFPEKFGVDKRTSHLSSMIVSGQLTREEALMELKEPLYEEDFMVKCKEKICQNLAISKQDLESLIKSKEHQHDEYPVDRFRVMVKRFMG